MNIYNEKQIILNINCLKIFAFAFMALLVCVWYYIYGVHGFYKLWKRKRTADEQSFSFWKLTKYFYCIVDFFIGEIE